MITLTISSSLPQFTQFLLERCGIEGNILTVDEARAAARHGSTWNDVVGVWKKRCPLEPEDESFVKLRTTLQALKKESPAAAPPAEPKAPPSPGTQRKLDELDDLGPAGMPNMLDEAKGLRRQFVPNENGEKGPDGKTGVWMAPAFGFGLRRAAREPRAYHAGCCGQLLATYLLTSPALGRR